MGWTRTRAALCVIFVAAVGGSQAAPQPNGFYPPLPSKAESAWAEYLKVTEYRINHELGAPTRFLALDFAPTALADRQAVQRGEIPVAQLTARWENGTTVSVPDHWVHHWRGAVLLSGVKLDRVFMRLKQEIPGIGTAALVKAEIRGRQGDQLHTFMEVQRSGSAIGVISYRYVYDTLHTVEFTSLSPTTGKSTSVATRIAERSHLGTPEERDATPKEDHRFLLRWNSYWRYQETAAGVIAECESITLSMDPGFLLSAVGARGIAESAAQDAMTQALVNLRAFFRTPPVPSPAR